MKFFIIALTAFKFFSVSAYADSCADFIKNSVEDRARIDLSRSEVAAVLPTFYDGGSVEIYSVPVTVPDSDAVLAIYSVQVGENCGIIRLNRL